MITIRSRTLQTVGAAWMTITLVFIGLRLLPGDALLAQLVESGASPAVISQRRADLGLDLPASVQYFHFLSGLLRGDLGTSLTSGQPVTQLLSAQLWPTVEITLASLAFAVLLGTLLGTAPMMHRVFAIPAHALITLGISAPTYWTGTLAIYLFTVELRLLPSGGAGSLSQIILPTLVLGWQLASSFGRVTQAALAEAARSPHMRTAAAKGLRRIDIALRHYLRPAVTPMIAHLSVQASFLIGGAVIVETVFSRPGLGRLLVDAVLRQDFPVVQGITTWICLAVALISLVADWLVFLADPRIRETA